jgi:hypothetical protein
LDVSMVFVPRVVASSNPGLKLANACGVFRAETSKRLRRIPG